MSSEAAVISNCREFRQRLEDTAARCGRDIAEITVVAVAKTRPLQDVLDAAMAGMKHFGENRVQEAERKYAGLERGFRLHMIGHLQSNKAKVAVELFDVIQSVDSIKLAEILEKEYARIGRRGEIMLEVNTSGEPQKYGLAPHDVAAVANRIFEMDSICLTGLMTVGPLTDDDSSIHRSFADLRDAFERIKSEHGNRSEFSILSMGMSDDYEIAVEEGASMIRVGRALFGPRTTLG